MDATDTEHIDGRWTGATPSMASTPRSATAADAGGGRPNMLIMDVCGAYMRPLGGWFAIVKIVQLMNELSVDATATRSALLRMRRKGLLEPEQRHGARGLRLSEQALTALADTDRRIYARRRPAYLGDGWVLVSFSVPENERSKRHVLRSQLSWLGFGNLSNGLWMAPRRMMDELRATVARLGFEHYVTIFEAQYAGFRELTDLVGDAWDLAELAGLYTDFVNWCAPIAARWKDDPAQDAARAFVDYTLALYHWRKFPYLDPGLPKDLLPPDWTGHRAAELFFDLRERLEPLALDHVRRTCVAR